MGFGLLKLASVGNENILVSQKPEITFFKKSISKFTFFGIEHIPQYFKSTPSFNRRVTLTLSKNADLLGDLYLYVRLPDINKSNHSILPDNIKTFSWVRKIGLAIIDYIDLEIDGILIQRFYNDWMDIFNECGFNNNLDIDKMIGNIDVNYNYSNGKKGYDLYIPLKFFFNLENYLYLPIVAMKKQNIKIHVKMNDINKCYKESPTNYIEINENICLFRKGELIKQTVDNHKAIGRFVYFDNINKRIYYDKVYNDFQIPTKTDTKYNIVGSDSGFIILPKLSSIVVSDESYFTSYIPEIKDSYIVATYVYLDINERAFFTSNKHMYIVPLIQNVLEKNIFSVNNNYKLTLTNTHKILFWKACLQQNISNNDIFNYSSYPATDKEQPLILSNTLYINSIPRVDINNFQFYTNLNTFINKLKSNNYIYSYSFSNNPVKMEPDGVFNFSQVDDTYLQLGLNNVINYQNGVNVKLYGMYYNVLVIDNNTSALKFI